jgi:teichuronic acid biosynthesis glycosyltransferase TuaH
VVVSSRVLRARMIERFGPLAEAKVRLVQNGVDESLTARTPAISLPPKDDSMLIGYAGTVARWFDFDAILGALDACEWVRLRVIGPRTGFEPAHDRIEYLPPVEHDQLPGLLAQCSALIMPFKVDSIVTAVNPVKLYEYLSYGVPVIVSRYEEIERDFGRFVEFYDSPRGLARLFELLRSGELVVTASPEARRSFLEGASWAMRWRDFRGLGEPE